MLEIKSLAIEFNSRRGQVKAVQGLSLSVKSGEILGLVGESGAGKSTVGTAIMGLLSAGGQVTEGQILFEGEDLVGLSSDALRDLRGRRIGMIFQDPMTALNPVRRVGDQLEETIRHALGLSESDARQRALEWLERMGLPDVDKRINYYPHEFSGGQRQRIVIALALCGEPDLVIADEPTTALDVSVQAQILGLIKNLVTETGVGVILVTHNMGVVAEVTDRVAIMRHGKLVESGPTQTILNAPETPYAQMLIGSVPPSDKRLRRLPMPDESGVLSAADLEAPKSDAGRDDILSVSGLEVTYNAGGLFGQRQGFKALKDINFTLKKGMSLGLVGESGSGKSTCARAIVGVAPITNGEVIYKGHNLVGMPEKDRRPLRSAIQMIFQDPYSSVNPRMRIVDIIAEPLRFYGIAANKSEIQGQVEALLHSVKLPPEVMKRYPHQFSGGQRQRIAIARTLASKPELIICDEPTSALDVSVQAQVLNLIKDLQDEYGLSLLFISHDLSVVRQMCDDILVLKDGCMVEHAPAEQLFTDPQQDYTQQLLALMPTLGN